MGAKKKTNRWFYWYHATIECILNNLHMYEKKITNNSYNLVLSKRIKLNARQKIRLLWQQLLPIRFIFAFKNPKAYQNIKMSAWYLFSFEFELSCTIQISTSVKTIRNSEKNNKNRSFASLGISWIKYLIIYQDIVISFMIKISKIIEIKLQFSK